MSPRAACRLEALGFTQVYDYVAGKVDWLAHNLPTHGEQASVLTAGALLRTDVPTADPTETVAVVAARVEASPYRFALVLADDRTLLGRLRHQILTEQPHRLAGDVAEPGPSTIRPHQPLDELTAHLHRHNLTYAIVADPEGHLLGTVHRDDLNATPERAPSDGHVAAP